MKTIITSAIASIALAAPAMAAPNFYSFGNNLGQEICKNYSRYAPAATRYEVLQTAVLATTFTDADVAEFFFEDREPTSYQEGQMGRGLISAVSRNCPSNGASIIRDLDYAF